jgi:protoheme IX farnesyltransferase
MIEASTKTGGFLRTRRAVVANLAPYLELTKPRVTLMVVVTAAAGFYLAGTGSTQLLKLLHTLLGTGLLAAGTSALNQVLEQGADARMRRTSRRPLPSGRLASLPATVFGLILILGGTLHLAVTTNGLTAFLGWMTAAVYLAVYTPLKTRTTLCTLVGAFPGAVPPVMGWTAVRGTLDGGAIILFAILFAWQFPHFLAISWIYKDDYRRGGFRMLPLVDPEGHRTGRQILAFSAALLLVSLVPTALNLTGLLYLLGALVLSLGFFWYGSQVAVSPSLASARRLLRASVIYLPLLLALMVVDKI